ncbi:MAG: hypothetical protein CMJ64_07795 [Planctomycetaceae bacterium]|nr:hypothetical protein [Planctomycetaceae bacterium]
MNQRYPQVGALSILLVLAGVVHSAEPIDIGSRRELFVDGYLIDKLEAARLTLHHPQPREVAIRFDQPWEGNTSGYPTVMRDGEMFKMIYGGHRMVWDTGKLQMSHSPVVCYAESRDGITWTKPHLREFPLLGQMAKQVSDPLANNIVWPGSPYSGTFVPFLDTRPGCPASEKFKAVGGNSKTGLHLFTSPDAIQWTKSEEAIFKQGALDSMNVVFFEPRDRQYVLYFRTVVEGMRSISMATSPDLVNWSEPVALEYPGSPRQQMYTNGIQPYYRAPHLRFGFPTRYTARQMTRKLRALEPVKLRAELTAAYARVGSDLTDGLFMSSRDGIRFHRWDEAFLRPGPEASAGRSNWMYGDNYQSYGLFETASETSDAPNEISMLFSEGYWRDGESRLRRYTIRLDGFVSVQTPFSGGEVVTKPLVFSGNELHINFSTSAAGSVRVEIQDVNGEAIPGYALDDCIELIGDSVEHIVLWKAGSDVGSLVGKPIQLRFVMKDADVYSFRFTGR